MAGKTPRFDVKLHDKTKCPEGFEVAKSEKQELKYHTEYKLADGMLEFNGVPAKITAHLETEFEKRPRTLRKPAFDVKAQKAYIQIEIGDPHTLAGKEGKSHILAAGEVGYGLSKTFKELDKDNKPRKYVVWKTSSAAKDAPEIDKTYAAPVVKLHVLRRNVPMFEQFAEAIATLRTLEADQKAGKDPLGIETQREERQQVEDLFAGKEPQSVGRSERGNDGRGRRFDNDDDNGHDGHGGNGRGGNGGRGNGNGQGGRGGR